MGLEQCNHFTKLWMPRFTIHEIVITIELGIIINEELEPGRQSFPMLNHFMCLTVKLRPPGRPREQIKCTHRSTAGQSDISYHVSEQLSRAVDCKKKISIE